MPNNLSSIQELTNQSFKLFKSRAATLYGISFVGFALILVQSLGLLEIATRASGSGNAGPESMLIIIVALLTIFVGCWQTAALIYAILSKQDPGAVMAYKATAKYALPFLWISIIMGSILLGGITLFIIPGIIFAFIFSLAPIVLVEDKVKGLNALLKSREYFNYNRTWSYTHMLFLVIISVLLAFIGGMLDQSAPEGQSIIGSILSFVITPFLMTYFCLMFVNIKKAKGDFAFEPKKSTRIGFIILGLIGPVVLIAAISGSLYLFNLFGGQKAFKQTPEYQDLLNQIEEQQTNPTNQDIPTNN